MRARRASCSCCCAYRPSAEADLPPAKGQGTSASVEPASHACPEGCMRSGPNLDAMSAPASYHRSVVELTLAALPDKLATDGARSPNFPTDRCSSNLRLIWTLTLLPSRLHWLSGMQVQFRPDWAVRGRRSPPVRQRCPQGLPQLQRRPARSSRPCKNPSRHVTCLHARPVTDSSLQSCSAWQTCSRYMISAVTAWCGPPPATCLCRPCG